MEFGRGFFPDDARLPFYMSYPAVHTFLEEEEYEKDSRKLQEMYPKDAKDVQVLVEDVCDRMEYEGSMMFDEYPDRCYLKLICRQIYRELTSQEELQGMAFEKDGLYQLIEVMLFQEMFRRRCRHRRCRRWY